MFNIMVKLDLKADCMRKEYDAVVATRLFEVALFGDDKWFNAGKLKKDINVQSLRNE